MGKRVKCSCLCVSDLIGRNLEDCFRRKPGMAGRADEGCWSHSGEMIRT